MAFFLYTLFLFAIIADRATLVAGVAQGSGSTLTNSLESPAYAEDQEEEDELLDSGTDHPRAATGFLPPKAEVQNTVPSTVGFSIESEKAEVQSTVPSTATVSQQMSTAPQRQPEAVFHFSPPRQHKKVVLPAQAAQARPPTLPSSAKVEAAVGGRRPASEAQAAPMSNHTGKTPMGLLSANVHLEESKPKVPWPPDDSAKYNVCDPPCIQGRGFCNDNMCFCKSPFVGSTCQKKTSGMIGLYRANRIMVVGVSVVCVVFGILLARAVNLWVMGKSEQRLQRYGKGKVKIEKWAPPDRKAHG